MAKDFLTSNSLKVRLDLSYFMSFITGERKEYHSDVMVNNPTMCNIASLVEQKYTTPVMLKWFFSIAIILFFPKISIAQYMITSVVLFGFGLIWRIIRPDIVIDFIINILNMIYGIISKLWFVPYIAIIIAGLLTRNYSLFISFFAVSAICSVISLLANNLLLNYTKKKYSYPLNDTELCAFWIFYIFLQRTEGISVFINDYLKYINESYDF